MQPCCKYFKGSNLRGCSAILKGCSAILRGCSAFFKGVQLSQLSLPNKQGESNLRIR